MTIKIVEKDGVVIINDGKVNMVVKKTLSEVKNNKQYYQEKIDKLKGEK